METISVQHASQIEMPAREWLQRLLGRSLGEDEQITILVATPHAAPSGASREESVRHLEKVLDKAAVNLRDVTDEQCDSAIDEAMGQIRKRADE